jgi:L-iditol 2-dehydrogenase
MKTIKLTKLHDMAMAEAPEPRLSKSSDVLIKVERVGVCGSDVHYYTEGAIGSQIVDYPFTVGHEGAGTVLEVGSEVTRVRPGDRIAFDPAMPCYRCNQCKAGRFHTCTAMRFLGCPGQAEGCLAELLVMPERSCFRVPNEMSFDEAAIIEPLSIGLYAVKLSGDVRGKAIGITGAGPIGTCVLLPARVLGASRVYMTDKLNYRVELARRAAADWAGNPLTEDVVGSIAAAEPDGLDVVFECSGDESAMDQALHLLKPGGKLMLIGIPGASNRVSFNIDLMRRKELTIQNVRRQNECVQAAIDMIAAKAFDVNIMVTHHLPLERTKEAFDLVSDYRDSVLKAMITFDA